MKIIGRRSVILVSAAVLSLITISTLAFTAPIGNERAEGTLTPDSAPMTDYEQFDRTELRNTVIAFQTGSSVLSENAKAGLISLVSSLSTNTTEVKIFIGAWSDRAYPMAEEASLSDSDVRLAKMRADSIISYVRTQRQFSGIKTVNMAERSGVLARFFGTDDANLKAAFTGEKTPDPFLAYQADVLRNNGGPQSAVIIISGLKNPLMTLN